MRRFFPFVLLLIVISPAGRMCAQTTGTVNVPATSPEELARAQQNIYASPPSLTLVPHSPQAHSGKIWLRSTDEGLHVWGRIEADEQGFHWPQQKSQMISGDHIEIWLATSRDVAMPKVGWGNQFGPIELKSLRDCAGQAAGVPGSETEDCERWYREQLTYRKYLRRLFIRQWLIAGSGSSSDQPQVFESFATEAYAGLSANFFPENLPRQLQPEPVDGVTAEIGAERQPEMRQNAAGTTYQYYRQTGYDFHLLIPYKAFPPAQQLKLADLYLMVDVFSSAPAGQKTGVYSSTSTMRRWGQPDTFNHILLGSPRNFSLTPCEYKNIQRDLYGKGHTSWFFPAQSTEDDELRSTFALINPAGGYMYSPGGLSPEVADSKYFWTEVTNGVTVCGPDLASRNGSTITRTEFKLDGGKFQAKAMPDGWTLVLSGPTASTLSTFGSGACGACTVMDFNIFAMSPKGATKTALALHETLTGSGDNPAAVDLTITPDWQQVIFYRDTDSWTSTTYCLEGHLYTQCGQAQQAEPPSPPHFKEFRLEDM